MKPKRFTLKEEHLKLLRRAYVDWWDAEYGAPCIGPKRPYGNGDVIGDILEILGWDSAIITAQGQSHPIKLTRETAPPAIILAAETIHKETETALQIVLRTGAFEPGIYEADAYDTNWRRV